MESAMAAIPETEASVTLPAQRERHSPRKRGSLLRAVVFGALALAAASCSTNLAAQNGYHDHNNDIPYWAD
jgi:hypothetical protein